MTFIDKVIQYRGHSGFLPLTIVSFHSIVGAHDGD